MRHWIKQRSSQRQYEILKAISFEWKRYKTRLFQPRKKSQPSLKQLQLGAGIRTVDGWLNVDLDYADVNLDLTSGKLPWHDSSFTTIISQHLIEHLFIDDELIPLLKETYRILEKDGSIWLATPDLEKMCHSYLDHDCKDLVEDREARMKQWKWGNHPTQHMMNDMFYQDGEHQNIFDFDLLRWTLQQAGFKQIERVSETILLEHFADFPPRNDELQSLYVRATK